MSVDPATILAAFSRWASFEWVATGNRHGNGGGVITARAALIAASWYAVTVAVLHILQPFETGDPHYVSLRQQVALSLPTFGAIFAGAYAALYARFSSQWTYLAGVYNQIKAAEVRGVADETEKYLAQWKAGFIEDADELHLARKPLFASIICAWSTNDDVKTQYGVLTAGRTERWTRIVADARVVFDEVNQPSKRNREPLERRK